MEFKFINKDNNPILHADLKRGEHIKLESGAMLYKTSGVELKGKTNGGVFKALGKSMFGGESFFTTEATALDDRQSIALAPRGIGDIYQISLTGTNWYLEDGAFLASSPSVNYGMSRQKGLGNAVFGGTGGFFILKTEGQGELFVESFGSIVEVELDGTQEYEIDNGHVIAWEETLNHTITRASGVFGFKTGEGLVIRFSGRGKILLQTRQVQSLAQKLIPFLPAPSSSGGISFE